MKFLPKTLLGKWAVGLSLAFIILMAIKIIAFLPLPTFFIATLGLAGFVVSIMAIFINKDRAILIFLGILVGVVIILWTVAEIISPY
jgi:hypothetical protein